MVGRIGVQLLDVAAEKKEADKFPDKPKQQQASATDSYPAKGGDFFLGEAAGAGIGGGCSIFCEAILFI